MNEDWATLARRYIPSMDKQYFDKAVNIAQDEIVVDFLTGFRDENIERVNELAPRIIESHIRDSSEALTAELIQTLLNFKFKMKNSVYPNIDSVSHDEIEEVLDSLELERLIELATELNDLECKEWFEYFLVDFILDVIEPLKHPESHDIEKKKGLYELVLPHYRRCYDTYMDSEYSDWYYYNLLKIIIPLSKIYSTQNEWYSSRKLYDEAYTICSRLRDIDSEYDMLYMFILPGLGEVLCEFDEFEKARKRSEEFEDIYSNHSDKMDNDEKLRVNMDVSLVQAYTNIVRCLLEQGENEEALAYSQAALNIVENLLHENPDEEEYESKLAKCFCHYGDVLYSMDRNIDALDYFRKGLRIFKRLAPGKYGGYDSDMALTLNRIAIVFRNLGKYVEAKEAYSEAISLYEKHSNWFGTSITYFNLGRLESDYGNESDSIECFKISIDRFEQDLSLLPETEHAIFHIHRSRIEEAYHCLIKYYAASSNPQDQDQSSELVQLIESLRSIKTLEAFGKTSYCSEVDRAFEDLIDGVGELTEQFKSQKCSFLYVQTVNEGVVFVTLELGKCSANICGRILLHHFEVISEIYENYIELLVDTSKVLSITHKNRDNIETLRKHLKSYPHIDIDQILNSKSRRSKRKLEKIKKNIIEDLNEKGKDALSNLYQEAEDAFDCLPEDIKNLFISPEYQTVFLSTGSTTINRFWDLLLMPVNDDGSDERQFLGLQKIMPRVFGLGGLKEILEREPKDIHSNKEKRVVLVGNPRHNGQEDLLDFAYVSEERSVSFRRCGFHPVPDGKAIINEAATFDTIYPLLDDSFTLLFLMCHGDLQESKDKNPTKESIGAALAGEDILRPEYLARKQWSQNPIIHITSCFGGRTIPRGGGKFEGFSLASIQAGASSVILAGVKEILLPYISEFNSLFYEYLLDKDYSLNVSEALLEARRDMADLNNNNPVSWLGTDLWGNPWTRLLPESSLKTPNPKSE